MRLALRGVTVLPPQDGDWFLIARDNENVSFVKRGGQTDHTIAAMVIVGDVPQPIADADQLRELVNEVQRRQSGDRFRFRMNDIREDRSRQALCVWRHSVAEDHKAVQYSSSAYLIIEAFDLYCLHPRNSSLLVFAGYSDRDQPGKDKPGLETRAKAFLDGVRFEGF